MWRVIISQQQFSQQSNTTLHLYAAFFIPHCGTSRKVVLPDHNCIYTFENAATQAAGFCTKLLHPLYHHPGFLQKISLVSIVVIRHPVFTGCFFL